MHRLFFAILFVTVLGHERPATGAEPYETTWKSLNRHQTPDWFLDAKFGIYTHWGPVTIGAEDAEKGRVQWYGMGMYQPKDPAFGFHRDKFGDQSEFGYKDIVKLFKAEKFDADAWAELFAASGARFAGPVAIHHDNFAMWDSAVTKWDSQDMGPNRDITRELATAIRKRDMKFIAAFHHAFTWRYFEPSYKFDGANPEYAGLYCQAHEPGAPPTQEFLDQWLAKVNEVVQKYEPDLIWFDFGLGDKKRNCISPEFQRRMFADYYNWAKKNDREVAVAHKHWDIHKHTGVIDFERGRMDHLPDFPWLTDTSVGPWFHQKSRKFKTVDQLVDVLVDIVSKNGCMLLNVGPTADGTIPPEARDLLLGIGQWLKINGEAIFDTRPWVVYGAGPTSMAKSGGFSEADDRQYTSQDIRYTRSKDGNTLYAIVLGQPDAKVTLPAMKVHRKPDVKPRITMLGYQGALIYDLDDNGQLVIQTPSAVVEHSGLDHAWAFKLSGFEIEPAEAP